MTILHTLLPELDIFPLFHPVNNGRTEHLKNQSLKIYSEEEVAAKILTAHALGMAKGGDDARAEMASELTMQKSNQILELESVRKAWVEEEGQQLAQLITVTLAEMKTHISQSLHQVMLPFIEKSIPQAAMDEFQNIIENAFKDDFKEPLFLSGPKDLVEELKIRLASKEIEIVTGPQSGIEVKARTASFVITTRIKKWTDGVRGTDS